MGTTCERLPICRGQWHPPSCDSLCVVSVVGRVRARVRLLPNDSQAWRRSMHGRRPEWPRRKPIQDYPWVVLPGLGTCPAKASRAAATPCFDGCGTWLYPKGQHLKSLGSTTGRGARASATAPLSSICNGGAPLMYLRIERLKPWPRGCNRIPTSRLSLVIEPKRMPQAFGRGLPMPPRLPTDFIS